VCRALRLPPLFFSSPFNGAQQVLKAVTAVAAKDVWAVGNTIDTASGSFLPDKSLVLHYNGTAWSGRRKS
jgi:hypothetical protein